MAASGIGDDGAWRPVFEGQRPPAGPGNELAVAHGALVSKARLLADERTREISDAIFDLLPVKSEAFRLACDDCAVVSRRIERAEAAIDRVDEELAETPLGAYRDGAEFLDRLRTDLARWIRLRQRILGNLGMTPQSQVQLGVALTGVEIARERFRDDLRRRYVETA